MREINLPPDYNYIGVFLTLDCNYRCSYCLNRFGESSIPSKCLSGEEWARGLNRINSRSGLPVTLQGGEPSLHQDFIYILNNLKPELAIDILTNLQFDPDEFISKVNPARLRRDARYASIRVSFHPEVMDFWETLEKSLRLLRAGFSIGIWAVEHPQSRRIIREAKALALDAGIDFRTKEFLGRYQERLYGTYKYEEACFKEEAREVDCRSSELIIGPGGDVYRCHRDAYAGLNPLGNILEADFVVLDGYRSCDSFGYCNPCDVKIKTNRFQEPGHTSVEIRKKYKK